MVAVVQQSELDRLADAADQLHPEGDAEPGEHLVDTAPAAPPTLTNTQCLMMAGQIVRDTLCAVAKVESPKLTLTDDTLQAVAAAVAPVLDKYGIDLGQMGGNYAVEIRAVMVTVPVILACRAGLRAELAAKREPQTAPAADAPMTDGNSAQA